MIRHTSARCLLLILLWPATGSAQTGSVTGNVVDQTALVLPGATVTLRGNGVPRTAYSDEQGTFELAGVAPGTYTLRVSLAGFSDATVENVTVSGAPLALPPVELQLASFGDTVVVTASRNEERLIDAPVSTSIISAATLETTSAQNYGDLLRATPGLNVIQLSARDVQVTSRSPGNTLTNSQLVLVDGRSAYLDFFGPRPVGPAPDQLRRRGADRGGAGAGVRGVGRERHDRRRQHHYQAATGIGWHDGHAQRRVR